MAYKHLAPFDPDRDFVCQTFFRAHGIAYARGDDFPGVDEKGEPRPRDSRLERLLYENHKIGFKDATPAEDTGSLAPATLTEGENGWWEVGAPWIDEPEKVHGADAAKLRAQQLRDQGEPLDHHGVAEVEGENGWWAVNAAWLPEPEKVHGKEAAHARAAELRKAGPPADWVDPSSLVGSDNFDAEVPIGDEKVALVDIVAAAQLASGHPAEVWNKLDSGQRDELIQAEIDLRTKGPAKAADEGEALKPGDVVLVNLEGNPLHGRKGTINKIEGEQAEVLAFGGDDLEAQTVPLAALSITQPDGAPSEDAELSEEARIEALVDGNTEAQLREKAKGLEGLGGARTKADIATLIVKAGRDVKAGDDGGAA